MSDPPIFNIKDSDITKEGWRVFTRSAPISRAFNHLIAGTHFEQKFGRWPLSPHDPAASINDLIVARMIDPRWSALQRRFVDKRTAKAEARRLHSALRVPETLAIIPMASVQSIDHLYEMLQPFIGTNTIAKPSHASGGTVFLRDVTSMADLSTIHELAGLDYAPIMREMQYWRLSRNIIVEAMIPAAGALPPVDYKFHCIHGEPLMCQVDHGRFGAPWSRVLRVPSFEPMDADDGLVPPEQYMLPDPGRLAAMTAAARALAAPFDYVRVDLYDGLDGVYFGELTFTPAAGLGIAPSAAGCHRETPTHRKYSRTLMTAFRRLR
ncbi:ATP-grasp fold amidoligase family protein [Sphingomonas sp. PB4P5]|uniref:ATP-grasp fold amidoligase family protein n=1 Tax=Parasphingomonas puruogangriensis TaxID=3096155 RepID=UPI002FC920A9